MGQREVRPLSHIPVGLAELFMIGLGLSSSYTMGHLKAADDFVGRHAGAMQVKLDGWLAGTGRGHSTDKAVTPGLAGYRAEEMDPDEAEQVWAAVCATKRLPSGAASEVWYSVGGGFVLRAGEAVAIEERAVPFPFCLGAELPAMGGGNELARGGDVSTLVRKISGVMFGCIERGASRDGVLPGSLQVKRRAKDRYAIAVNEQNTAVAMPATLGGTNEQAENAAGIAIEHHAGLTCDPVGGFVQIPCIERNAFGAVKATQASTLALLGDGTHRAGLDQVIETMRQTGAGMCSKKKETSRGGLAVNVPEC